ncbi:DUF4232 domain-containing protein [Kribbella sp. NPDC050459]|uniref:DUF4232 domain-containing protein n=1 Tax=Kribbella sp. NPDC050459 TaxID=3155785 RepID=UPI0033CF8D1D
MKTSWRRHILGAGLVATVLTTAACGSGNTSDGSKPSDQQRATTSASATTSATPPSASTEPAASSSARPSSTPKPTKTTGDDSSVELCTMADLTLAITNYDAQGEEVRHLMLVATNLSAKKCDVQNYPEVTLGDAQRPASVKEGTDSGEAITLAPGEKAYAGVLTTGGHMDTYSVKYVAVSLGSPGGEAEAEKPTRVKMPVTSFEADDGQRVTYWAGTEGLAMRPVTQS